MMVSNEEPSDNRSWPHLWVTARLHRGVTSPGLWRGFAPGEEGRMNLRPPELALGGSRDSWPANGGHNRRSGTLTFRRRHQRHEGRTFGQGAAQGMHRQDGGAPPAKGGMGRP